MGIAFCPRRAARNVGGVPSPRDRRPIAVSSLEFWVWSSLAQNPKPKTPNLAEAAGRSGVRAPRQQFESSPASGLLPRRRRSSARLREFQLLQLAAVDELEVRDVEIRAGLSHQLV